MFVVWRLGKGQIGKMFSMGSVGAVFESYDKGFLLTREFVLTGGVLTGVEADRAVMVGRSGLCRKSYRVLL